MRRTHNILKRILVLILCMCLLTGNSRGFSSFAAEDGTNTEEGGTADSGIQVASDDDGAATSEGADDSSVSGEAAGGNVSTQAANQGENAASGSDEGAGNAGAGAPAGGIDQQTNTTDQSGTGSAGTTTNDLSGTTPSSQNTSANINGNDNTGNATAGTGAGNQATDESAAGSGASNVTGGADSNASVTSGTLTTDENGMTGTGAGSDSAATDMTDDEDEDDELTPEEEEELRKALEENGVMPLAAGDPISINGRIVWSGDEYWKGQTQPSLEAIKSMIKLYSVSGGVETPIPTPNVITWDADGNTGFRIDGLKEPDPATTDYIIRVDGLTSYAVTYNDGDHAKATPEQSAGVTTGMKASDITATLDYQDMTIVNKYYGDGTPQFTYAVKAGKNGDEKDFHGTYTVGTTTTPVTTGDGKVKITAADGIGTEKTATIRVPKGLKMTASAQADGYQTVMKETTDADGNVTGYVFTHISSDKTVKATKKWNDNNRPHNQRPAITMKLYFSVDGGEMKELTDATKSQIGLTDDQALPAVEVNQLNINNYEYSFKKLPEGVLDGDTVKTITYNIKEELPADSKYDSVTTTNGTDTVITNTYTEDFSASIVWKDGAPNFPFRPDNVNLVLKRYSDNPTAIYTVPLTEYKDKMTISGNETANWSVSITDLPGYADDGYPYTYFLVEEKPEIITSLPTGESPPAGTEYDDATYTNTGNHAQATDKCFNGGTIINTKVADTSFNAKYKWTNDDDRPDAKIYLYRYLEGEEPVKAAAVRIPNPANPNGEWSLQYVDVENTIATGTEKEFSFTDLPKYDPNGNEYVYIAKAVAEGTTYMYYYPEGQDYGVEEDGMIVFVPQKTVEKKFTLTWNSAAYPNTPTPWTENVVLQAKGADDVWKEVSGPQYTEYKDLSFTDFNPGETTKEMTLFLPMYGRDGSELEYRVVMKDLQKGDEHVTTEIKDGKNLFEIDGRQYEVTDDGLGNLVNSLYNKLEYKVTKKWTDNSATPITPQSANISLMSGTQVATGLNAQLCEITLNDTNAWEYTFIVNRYDESGHERSFSVDETDFQPRQDGDGKNFASYIHYGREGTDDSKLWAKIDNSVPTGNDKYISIRKVWKDGGDIQDRKTITVEITDTTDSTYVRTEKIGAGTQWKIDYNIGQHNPANIVVEEIKVGDSNVDRSVATDLKVTCDVAVYKVNETKVPGSNAFVITNSRTGNVKVVAEINWSDASDETNRPQVTAILQKKDTNGNWVDYVPSGASGKLELKKDDFAGNDTWSYAFKDTADNDLLLPKYDADGNVISYNFRIEYASVNDETYETTKERSWYTATTDVNVSDAFNKSFTLTRHSSKEVVIHKRWMGDQVKEQPDIYLTLKRGVKKADGTTTSDDDLEDYTELDTEFGKIETVIERIDDLNYTYKIRNLEKHNEAGEEYMYYVTEHMDNSNGYKGYYFDKEEDIADWTTTASGEQYVLTGGWIVNRQEGTMRINGTKKWQDLEPGTGSDKLPDPTIQLFREVKDSDGNSVPDYEFNGIDNTTNQPIDGKGHKITLKTEKYTWSFPENEGDKELPIYDDQGRKYIYTVKETLTEVADRVYFKSNTDEFALVNQYITSKANTRKITVQKTWSSDITINNAQYPNVTYELYRYVASDPDGTKTINQLHQEALTMANNDTDLTPGVGEKVGECTLYFGGKVGDTVTKSYTFDNLRIAAPSGADYVYKVVEKTLDGYLADDKVKDTSGNYAKTLSQIVDIDTSGTTTVSNTDVDFRNKYVGDEIVESKQPNPSVTIEGDKNWYDTGYTNLRPANVDLELWRYAEESSGVRTPAQKVEIDGTNVKIEWTNTEATSFTWHYKITEKGGTQGNSQVWLLTYAPNGARYKYYVIEKNVPNYEPTEGKTINQKTDDQTSHVITMNDLNNYMNISLKVVKKWDDSGNTYGLRPKQITVQLQRATNNPTDPTFNPDTDWTNVVSDGSNGTGPGEQIIKDTNGWTYTYTRLPVRTNDGKPCYYRVIETKIGDAVITGTVGNKSPYTVQPNSSYHSGNATLDTTTITNTLQPVNLTVTKIWAGDQGDLYNTRPKVGNTTNWTVTVQLQKKSATGADDDMTNDAGWENVTERTITGSQNTVSTTITYSGLPKCANDGTMFLYRAVEINVPKNYQQTQTHEVVDLTSGQKDFKSTITNTLQVKDDRKNVTVKKTWNPTSEATGAKKVTVQLQQKAGTADWKAVNATVATKELSAGLWEYTWTDVPKFTATGDEITYQVEEIKVTEGTSTTDIKSRFYVKTTDAMDTATNTHKFEIVNSELIDYVFNVKWENNTYGMTKTATFTLYRTVAGADGAVSGNPQSEREGTTGWEKVTKNAAGTTVPTEVKLTGNITDQTWKNLPKYDANGNEYIYQVAETKIASKEIPNPYTTGDNYKTYNIVSERKSTTAASGITNEKQKGTVTNTLITTTKSGTKKWNFANLNENLYSETAPDATATYRATLLPSDITVKLKYDAATANTFEDFTAAPLSSSTSVVCTWKKPQTGTDLTTDWSYSYANLPKYALDGTREIKYQAVETYPTGKNYENAFINTANNNANSGDSITTITNTIATETVTGKKTWSDFNNQYGLRPDSLTLTVNENGTPMNPQPAIVWTPAAGSATGTTQVWTYSIEGLPAYVWNGTSYRAAVYTVEETRPVRYWRKDNTADNNKGLNFDNQLCVIRLLHTVKGDESAEKLNGAQFSLSGTFEKEDGTTKSADKTLTLTNGELVLTPANLGEGNLGLIPGNEYTLKQLTPVSGYQKIVGEVKFTVDKNGLITINTNTKMQDSDTAGTYSDAAKVYNNKAPGAPNILQIQNCKTLAKVKLTKVDKEDTNITLSGVKFKLYKQTGTNPDVAQDKVITATGGIDPTGNTVLTTNKSGVIEVSGLEEGKYYFVEVETLGNYEVDDAATDFVVKSTDHWTGEGKTIPLTMKNTKLDTELRMIKRDAVSGDPIQGVKFKVTFQPAPLPDGTTPAPRVIDAITKDDGTLVTDDAAKATIKLEKGTYTVEEISSVTGYYKEVGGKTFKCTFEIKDGQQIEAVKLSEDWLNQINRGDSSKRQREIINFQCESFNTFMHKDGNKGDGVYNTRILGSVKIHKVDGEDTSINLNDVEFKLEKKKDDGWVGNMLNLLTGKTYEVVNLTASQKTFTNDGVLLIKDLEWGEYRITETKPNDGYKVFKDDPYLEFKVWGGDDGVLDHVLQYGAADKKITNFKTEIKIGVEETYNAGDLKADVHLELTGLFAGKTDITTRTWTSADDAMEELKGELIVGKTYELTQTVRPTGYEPWKETLKFTLDENGKIVFLTDAQPEKLSDGKPVARTDTDRTSLYVRNVKVNGRLRIVKTGASDLPLKGVTFDLYKEGETTPYKTGLTTDANGVFVSDPAALELPEGKYFLKETWTHASYREATDVEHPFEISVEDHYESGAEPILIEVKNVPKLNLVDVNTDGDALNGYEFEVLGVFRDRLPGADPAVSPDDEQTFILTKDTLELFNSLLKPGSKYKLKQIGIDKGYVLTQPIEITVNDDYSVDVVETPEYLFDKGTGTFVIINRQVPKVPSGGGGIGGGGGGEETPSGGTTPPGGGGKGGPGGDTPGSDAGIPTYTTESAVPDPNAPDAPPIILLVRGDESKLFFKTLLDNEYVYMSIDGEVLGHRRARAGQTGDPIRTDMYILMTAVGCLGVLVATGNISKKRKKKERAGK